LPANGDLPHGELLCSHEEPKTTTYVVTRISQWKEVNTVGMWRIGWGLQGLVETYTYLTVSDVTGPRGEKTAQKISK
jgi:hypothetical protein